MRVRIYGTPPKRVKMEDLRECIDFVADQLFSPQLKKHIYISIFFRKLKRCDGSCTWMDRLERPRKYQIEINGLIRKSQRIYEVIAHEMTHVMQFATGHLTDNLNEIGPRVRWKNKIYKDYGSPEYMNFKKYMKQPWEIEARRNEMIGIEYYENNIRGRI